MTAYSVHPCEIHQSHGPKNLTTESHHIIPRAWQGVWHPADDQRVLWAPKTVELCPTGHRNVHQILVAIMKEFEKQSAGGYEESINFGQALREAAKSYGRLNEFDIAATAPREWLARGGALSLLVANKQYGFGMTGFSTGGFITGGATREGFKL